MDLGIMKEDLKTVVYDREIIAFEITEYGGYYVPTEMYGTICRVFEDDDKNLISLISNLNERFIK